MRNITNLIPDGAAGLVSAIQQQDGVTAWSKSNKAAADFRDYTKADVSQPSIAEFYKQNHIHQTLDHVLAQKAKYCDAQARNTSMGIWQVLEILDQFVDESDPDTEMSQIVHSLQSAEAARRDGQPRWMILTALIHDIGKWISVRGEPQWTVMAEQKKKGGVLQSNTKQFIYIYSSRWWAIPTPLVARCLPRSCIPSTLI